MNGIYQTRATFLRWAACVHEATWEMELPTRPYIRPDDSVFEIVSVSLNVPVTCLMRSYRWPTISHRCEAE